MKLAIFTGSFSPFHKGHYNILLKAEKIFDKVIIAKGVNLAKDRTPLIIPKTLADREVIEYGGLMTEMIEEVTEKYGVIPTLVRGLRNANDLQYELTQYRYLQDLMPEIQMVSILCDREYEHVSSSGIRLLSQCGSDKVKKYLID